LIAGRRVLAMVLARADAGRDEMVAIIDVSDL
jgi:hypothetical protein